MNFIKTKDATGNEIKLPYEDTGSGKPVVFIHGWPLSKEMWEYQVVPLAQQGMRCITYDRRGFGNASRPWTGYDYDTLASDLKALLDQLDLQDVTLVGFSMGGGEVVRYFSKYGGARVTKAVLLGSITPYMLKTQDNTDGTPEDVFNDITNHIKDDRIAFFDGFGKAFYGVGFINKPVSTPFLEWSRMLASVASPKATLDCAASFSHTDFRNEMSAVTVPTLIIHGDADNIVPIKAAGDISAKLIPNNQYLVYADAPHGLFYTHKEQLNADLLNFILGSTTYTTNNNA